MFLGLKKHFNEMQSRLAETAKYLFRHFLLK